jgi:hypothetical protein
MRGLRGGSFRGSLRGGLRGGFRGGYPGAAGGGAGRDFSNDLYADYSGPDQAAPGGAAMPGYGGGAGYGSGATYSGYDAEPSQQIMVRNVSTPLVAWCIISHAEPRLSATVVHG